MVSRERGGWAACFLLCIYTAWSGEDSQHSESLTTFCSRQFARGESQIQKRITGLTLGESAAPLPPTPTNPPPPPPPLRPGNAWPDTALCWRPQCSPPPATSGSCPEPPVILFSHLTVGRSPGILRAACEDVKPAKTPDRSRERGWAARAPRQPPHPGGPRTQAAPAPRQPPHPGGPRTQAVPGPPQPGK